MNSTKKISYFEMVALYNDTLRLAEKILFEDKFPLHGWTLNEFVDESVRYVAAEQTAKTMERPKWIN